MRLIFLLCKSMVDAQRGYALLIEELYVSPCSYRDLLIEHE